jgi:hypothetical protein
VSCTERCNDEMAQWPSTTLQGTIKRHAPIDATAAMLEQTWCEDKSTAPLSVDLLCKGSEGDARTTFTATELRRCGKCKTLTLFRVALPCSRVVVLCVPCATAFARRLCDSRRQDCERLAAMQSARPQGLGQALCSPPFCEGIADSLSAFSTPPTGRKLACGLKHFRSLNSPVAMGHMRRVRSDPAKRADTIIAPRSPGHTGDGMRKDCVGLLGLAASQLPLATHPISVFKRSSSLQTSNAVSHRGAAMGSTRGTKAGRQRARTQTASLT